MSLILLIGIPAPPNASNGFLIAPATAVAAPKASFTAPNAFNGFSVAGSPIILPLGVSSYDSS